MFNINKYLIKNNCFKIVRGVLKIACDYHVGDKSEEKAQESRIRRWGNVHTFIENSQALHASEQFSIVSEDKKPQLDCSQWPLLLKVNLISVYISECSLNERERMSF